MSRAYLDLGSNIDRVASLKRAVDLLQRRFEVLRLSCVYETEPVGFAEQPAFYNMSVELSTDQPADELRKAFRAIEDELGRVRTSNKYGPRTIDIDLVLYGDYVHPQVASQAFVLLPLCELAPQLKHPQKGRSLSELAGELELEPGAVRKVGPLAGLTG